MTDTPHQTGGDGGDDSLLWDIFKVVAFLIGAIVLISWAFRFLLSWAVPLIVIGILAFVAYKVFLEDDSTSGDITANQDPPLLEHEARAETDDILDDDVDPLEKEFEELERRDSSAT